MPPSAESVVITAALPYANGELHIGHVVSTYLPSDIFARYCRLRGRRIVFLCATDDFGTPILIKAEQEGRSPSEYVRQWYERDLNDFRDFGISFDIFHQTSSKENIELTQYFFRKLHEKGHIYSQRVRQPYCEKDQKFLPDRYVVGTCPFCGAARQYSDGCEKCGRTLQAGEILNPACAVCGSTPVEKESDHYFFRLSSFSEDLRRWLQGTEGLQEEITKYVLNWIESGLKDWDITRDISWGVPIPLPEAAGKVLYGWFDNHLCYIATLLLHMKRMGEDGAAYWNGSKVYHFIGKDIVYHHYLFLPAMRMGVGGEYRLPDAIPVRGHLMLESQKISKSRGWYISLREFLDTFPADYLRFYCASITPLSQADVNFSWDEFQAKINNELVANIGNFIYRTLSFIHTRRGGRVPEPGPQTEGDVKFRSLILSVPEQVARVMDANEIDRALRIITEFSAACNQYFQSKQPWKEGEGSDTCLYLSANGVYSLIVMLNSFLPSSTERIRAQMEVKGEPMNWSSLHQLSIRGSHQIGRPEIPFKKIEDSEILDRKRRLGEPPA